MRKSLCCSDLERSWKKIREEGLALLRSRDAALFQDEAESLRDTGDWKQLDLFSRGQYTTWGSVLSVYSISTELIMKIV